MILCKYPKIKGGINAIIEEDRKIIAHKKFIRLNEAINWTNSFIEGYVYGKI